MPPVPRGRVSPKQVASSPRWKWIGAGLVLAVIAGVFVTLRSHSQPASPPPVSAPASPQPASYAGSSSCRDCHAPEFNNWRLSHHALAERPADSPIDLAEFPRRAQNQPITLNLDGQPRPIVRVIGLDPLRQFLTPTTGGRLQATELAYDPAHHDWFDVYGSENRQIGEWGHWTGRGMNWNAMCAACHNTNLRKNYSPATDSYQTAMAELGVGCEACHGPMQPHVQWQRDHPPGGAPEPHGAAIDRERMLDVCAACHARRAELTGEFSSGNAFFNHFTLSGVDDTETFYPDGQIHEEDYEFSAFLGSRMYAAGVRCVDCHEPHSGKTILAGDALCMRCHVGAYPKAPIIVPARHTFHSPRGEGSRCVNCHMPQTQYMQRHGRHDHGFTTPDPLLTAQANTPNACNRCHRDKDADWALAAARQWYGEKLDRPARRRALAIAAARRGDPSAKPAIVAQLGTPGNPSATIADRAGYWTAGFVKLLARWADEPDLTPALLAQIDSPHPMVREAAVNALAPLAGARPPVAAALARRCDDPSLNVRIAAAHALGPAANPASPAAADYARFLAQQADQPLGQLQLAMRDADAGRREAAEAHLRKALAWDERSAALRREAAVLFGALGMAADARQQIKQACALEPNNAEYQYLAGLSAAENGDLAASVAALRRAISLDPSRPRAWYNLALALDQMGSDAEALAALDRAQSLDAADADIPYARATVLLKQKRFAEAKSAAEQVLRLRPGDVNALAILQGGSP